MSLPFSSAYTPRLPLDVVHLVAQAGIGAAVKEEERELAQAVSLVCRDWRDVGQSALWRRLTLPRALGGWRKARGRLFGMVRELRWEEVEVEGGSEESSTEAVSAFLGALETLAGLEKVELHHFPVARLTSALCALLSSPSLPRLTTLTLDGSFAAGSRESRLDETTLIRVLRGLPALSTFSCDLAPLLPPSSPSPTSPAIPLRRLLLGAESTLALPEDALFPGIPNLALCHAVDVDALREAVITVDIGRSGWLRFPLVSSFLPQFPSLQYLRVHDKTFRGATNALDEQAFLSFLAALPPSLPTLHIDFAHPYHTAWDFLEHGSGNRLKRAILYMDEYTHTFTKIEGTAEFEQVGM
ncbi:hypothetical protein JCM10213v2_009084 [Rhodosporidiobolus nylandii]